MSNKGVRIRINTEHGPILDMGSLDLHYIAQLQNVDSWSNWLQLQCMDGTYITIQMKAVIEHEPPED